MKDFIYSEKFDSYLKGKLDPHEQHAMEDEIRQDPLLSSEVKLQKEIHHALAESRRTYLKNRLDQVPVNTATWLNLSGFQWAAILSSLFVLSSASYYFLSTTSQEEESDWTYVVERDALRQIPFSQLPDLTSPDSKSDEAAPEDIINQSTNADQSDDDTVPNSPVAIDASPKSQGTELLPEIVRPDIQSDFADSDQEIDYSDFEAPDKSLLQKSEASTNEVEVETIVDSNYSFHYQLYDHKLYLHGDFQGIPYKIIALNQENRKKLFLQFNDDYYTLKQEQKEVAPLEKIVDSTIIGALNRLGN
jgi:hypothetical protein